jgi:hypothetical protein
MGAIDLWLNFHLVMELELRMIELDYTTHGKRIKRMSPKSKLLHVPLCFGLAA